MQFTIRDSSWSLHQPFMRDRYKVEGPRIEDLSALMGAQTSLLKGDLYREHCDNKRRESAKNKLANTI